MLPVSLIRDLSLSLQSLWGHKAIVVWCNGSTTGFGSVCPGSNPGTTAVSGGVPPPVSFSSGYWLSVRFLGTNLNIHETINPFQNAFKRIIWNKS